MEKEQVAVDEAVETVAEQNARAYSKTVWDESTPITADKLNKIENGIANALDTTTGGTVKGKLTVKGNIQSDGGNFYSNKNGGNKPVIEVFDGDKNGSAVVYSGGALTVLAGGESGSVVVQNTNNTQEDAVVSADQGVKLYANLQNGWDNRKTVELTPGGRFKLNNNSLELSPNNSGYARIGLDGDTQDVYISNINNNWFRLKGDKTITYAGNKVYTSFDKPTAGDVGALSLTGGTLTGNLVFANTGGSGLTASISNSTLHAATGNGQMMNVGDGRIYVGNPNTFLTIESNTTPDVNIGGNRYQLFHTGNFNPAAKLDAGNFSISNRDLLIYGKRAMVGLNTADGNCLYLNYDRDFANGVVIQGLTKVDKIENSGNLVFTKTGGGGINACIANSTLQAATGNGQMINVGSNNAIFIGNPNTPLNIESNGNVAVLGQMRLNNNGSEVVFHEVCNARDIGMYLNNNNWGIYDYQNSRTVLRYNMDGDRVEIQGRRAATWEGSNPAHHMFRYGSGLGGANGYITFSY